VPVRWVLIRDARGLFAPQALLCTDIQVAPEQVVAWFVRRWQLAVIFEAARCHLGVETQRQWSEQAIRRTTPALLGLFSLVTVVTHQHVSQTPLRAQAAAWYPKAQGRGLLGFLVAAGEAALLRTAPPSLLPAGQGTERLPLL